MSKNPGETLRTGNTGPGVGWQSCVHSQALTHPKFGTIGSVRSSCGCPNFKPKSRNALSQGQGCCPQYAAPASVCTAGLEMTSAPLRHWGGGMPGASQLGAVGPVRP